MTGTQNIDYCNYQECSWGIAKLGPSAISCTISLDLWIGGWLGGGYSETAFPSQTYWLGELVGDYCNPFWNCIDPGILTIE